VTTALVVALALAASGGIVLLQRVRHTRRLREVLAGLGDTAPRSLEEGFDRLERAVRAVARQDEEVHRAEVRLERALSEMTQGAVICDAAGRVVLRNSFAQSFVGARHGDVLVEAAITELLTLACRGEGGDREIELYGPPARTLFVHTRPLLDGVTLVGAIAFIDDVTELQRIDAVRRDFVSNISHELRTPIGAIALLAETVAGEDDPDVMRRLAARLRDESFRLTRIIEDLLALSRLEGGDIVEPRPVDIGASIDEAAARVAAGAEQRGVRIDVTPPRQGIGVLGDARQIISAVVNLLDNAVKYSDRGATVEVRCADDAERVAIVVTDHGMGIPTKDLDRVFERFYRVDQARSRETGGTGLGLAIVRHVARNHGGEVTVTSREGEGSTFSLLLPTAAATSRRLDGAEAEPAVPAN